MKLALFAALLPTLVAVDALAAVITADVTMRDEHRGKSIECRVYYPEAGAKLPLIIFSHGFGGDKTAFAAISEHVAAHGYVLIHPSHADGFGRSGGQVGGRRLPGLRRDADPAQGPPDRPLLRSRRAGGGLVGLLDDPVKIEERVGDVTFLLDASDKLADTIPVLKDRVDTTRLGVGGHSFGAYTAMLIGGVTVDLGEKTARSFADKRVRCILPISAQGTGQQGLTRGSWDKLQLPMLTMTGSRDQGAAGQGPEWKQEPFQFSPPGDKYLVLIEGANHFSFGGFRGRETDITRAVQATALAFWNAYLKEEDQARESLQSGSVIQGFRVAKIMAK